MTYVTSTVCRQCLMRADPALVPTATLESILFTVETILFNYRKHPKVGVWLD